MQKNKISNARFLKQIGEEIVGFEGQGYYLGQKVSGYLTCVAMEKYPYAIYQTYNQSIDTTEKTVLFFGYTMRAIVCEEVILQVTYYDEQGVEIGKKQKEVTQVIHPYYAPIMEKFYLPKTCASAKVQLMISGKVQGLSFFAPTVYVL